MLLRSMVVLLLCLSGAIGCAKKLAFPDQSTVAATQALSIDGDWRLLTGNTASVFKVDKGRMFYLDKQKPPRGLRRENVLALSSEFRSPTDYSRQPGSVIAMNIRESGDAGQYSCRMAVYNTTTRTLEFVMGQIVAPTDDRIVLKAFSGAANSRVTVVEERFVRASAAGAFSSTRVPSMSTNKDLEASRAAARKTTVIPPEKMESGGQLSPSAQDFIRQTVSSSRAAEGAVEIRYPPRTSRRIVKALQELGAVVAEDATRSDYEVIVILIKPGSAM